MAECKLCGKKSALISSALSLCLDCIRTNFAQAKVFIEAAHRRSRQSFALPVEVPRAKQGRRCKICVNECCLLREKDVGFCALPLGGRDSASVEWYYDALPTNCVADWVCPGCSFSGYREFSYRQGAEFGYKNLAVFYNACSFNCLFCQNWHFKEADLKKRVSAEELAACVDERTSCICFFGGDPTPQLPHALAVARIARKKSARRILRICWETNGSMQRNLLKQMLDLSLESGGCVKFDLKAYSENLHLALCAVTNRRTLENIEFAASYIRRRPEPPILVVSTLLVPGYVDTKEVENIAQFLARLNPAIPFSLLAFYPQFYLRDLPTTSLAQAKAAQKIAEDAGLKKIKIGNIHLLSA